MPRAHSIRRPAAKHTHKRSFAGAIDDGWALRRFEGLEILTARVFDAHPWVIHGFSTRIGGASQLDGSRVLNLGFTDWDNRESVLRNRAAFERALAAAKSPSRTGAKTNAPHRSLVTIRQTHSDVVQIVSGFPASAPPADAAISRQPGLLLGVQTADCVPILLADPRRRVVAAVHAGWRGTLARIVGKTLGRMRLEFGTHPEDVRAAIGPAIGRCCYEVGPEVAQAFSGQFAPAAEWFDGPFDRLSAGEEPNPLPWLTMMPPGHQPPPERVQLDLPAANRWQLIEAGANPKNIAVSSLCTGCRSDLFFSYRKQGAGTGRMLSAIGIREKAD